MFGTDYVGGQTVGLTFGVDGLTRADAESKLSTLTKAWRADPVRLKPGAVAELVSHNGRRLMGRPRRFAPVRRVRPEEYIEAVADFTALDDRWYGPQCEASVSIAPAPAGGFVFPLVFPAMSVGVSTRSVVVTVGGDLPTWGRFVVQGPIVNPVIELVGLLRFEFNLSLAYDEMLVVDTRPWVRSIMRGSGSVAGSATRKSTRITASEIPPGRYELVLRGTSVSGTANLRMVWSDAFSTP